MPSRPSVTRSSSPRVIGVRADEDRREDDMARLAARDDRQAGGLDLATPVIGEREVLVPKPVRHREGIDAVRDRQDEDRDLARRIDVCRLGWRTAGACRLRSPLRSARRSGSVCGGQTSPARRQASAAGRRRARIAQRRVGRGVAEAASTSGAPCGGAGRWSGAGLGGRSTIHPSATSGGSVQARASDGRRDQEPFIRRRWHGVHRGASDRTRWSDRRTHCRRTCRRQGACQT